MPGSAPNSTERPSWPRDDGGVSEVVGSILGLAIVSLAVVSGLFALTTVQDASANRAVATQADRAAATVANAASRAASSAMQAATDGVPEPTVRIPLELPANFEGRGYALTLEPTTHTVAVSINGEIVARASIIGQGTLTACSSGASGGRLIVAFEDVPATLEASCGVGPSTHALLLRSDP